MDFSQYQRRNSIYGTHKTSPGYGQIFIKDNFLIYVQFSEVLLPILVFYPQEGSHGLKSDFLAFLCVSFFKIVVHLVNGPFFQHSGATDFNS